MEETPMDETSMDEPGAEKPREEIEPRRNNLGVLAPFRSGEELRALTPAELGPFAAKVGLAPGRFSAGGAPAAPPRPPENASGEEASPEGSIENSGESSREDSDEEPRWRRLALRLKEQVVPDGDGTGVLACYFEDIESEDVEAPGERFRVRVPKSGGTPAGHYGEGAYVPRARPGRQDLNLRLLCFGTLVEAKLVPEPGGSESESRRPPADLDEPALQAEPAPETDAPYERSGPVPAPTGLEATGFEARGSMNAVDAGRGVRVQVQMPEGVTRRREGEREWFFPGGVYTREANHPAEGHPSEGGGEERVAWIGAREHLQGSEQVLRDFRDAFFALGVVEVRFDAPNRRGGIVYRRRRRSPSER